MHSQMNLYVYCIPSGCLIWNSKFLKKFYKCQSWSACDLPRVPDENTQGLWSSNTTYQAEIVKLQASFCLPLFPHNAQANIFLVNKPQH